MSHLAKLFVSPKNDDRNNNINAIRYIAAAMVIYGHMGHLGGYPVPQLFGEDISTIAVKIFFVLSGYLITQSYLHDGNIFRYGIRRVFRIFPGLIFVCFVTTFIVCPFISTLGVSGYFAEPGSYLYFIKNSLMNMTYGLLAFSLIMYIQEQSMGRYGHCLLNFLCISSCHCLLLFLRKLMRSNRALLYCQLL